MVPESSAALIPALRDFPLRAEVEESQGHAAPARPPPDSQTPLRHSVLVSNSDQKQMNSCVRPQTENQDPKLLSRCASRSARALTRPRTQKYERSACA